MFGYLEIQFHLFEGKEDISVLGEVLGVQFFGEEADQSAEEALPFEGLLLQADLFQLPSEVYPQKILHRLRI